MCFKFYLFFDGLKANAYTVSQKIERKNVIELKPMSIKINFHFEPNEFFENTVLTKEYMLRNEYDKERDKNRITWVFYTFDYSCQSVT